LETSALADIGVWRLPRGATNRSCCSSGLYTTQLCAPTWWWPVRSICNGRRGKCVCCPRDCGSPNALAGQHVKIARCFRPPRSTKMVCHQEFIDHRGRLERFGGWRPGLVHPPSARHRDSPRSLVTSRDRWILTPLVRYGSGADQQLSEAATTLLPIRAIAGLGVGGRSASDPRGVSGGRSSDQRCFVTAARANRQRALQLVRFLRGSS
jgi:hypothetical protein